MREWLDVRDKKKWVVTAKGVPRNLAFRCTDTLERYSVPAEGFVPVARYGDDELAGLLDRARRP